MPHRVSSLVSVVFASSLAAAMLPTANSPVSAADECIGKPNLELKQAGHWYYRTDRVRHRRCWLFETSEVPDSVPSSADQVPAAKADSESWFFHFAAGLAQVFSSQPNQTSILAFSAEQKQSNISAFSSEPQQSSMSSFSSEPQQRGILDKSSTVTNTASLRHPRANKIARRERSRIDSPPTTSGLASARHDQMLVQGTPEKDDKLSRQLTAAERQALFEEFLKWYKDTSVFGQP